MTSTLALASRLRALEDNELIDALERRRIPTSGIRDFFDLADALLDADSLQSCLVELDGDSLDVLAAPDADEPPHSTPQRERAHRLLTGLLLLDDTSGAVVAWPEVIAQLRRWPTLGLPDLRNSTPEPSPRHVSDTVRRAADRATAEHAFVATAACAELVYDLEREPVHLLARGEPGRSETRRLANLLGVEESRVAVIVEAATRPALVERAGSSLIASENRHHWLAADTASRWVTLAEAWASALPGALRESLAAKADSFEGDALVAWLRWFYPGGHDWLPARIEPLLLEAETLGLTANGVLSRAAAALLAGDHDLAARLVAAELPPATDRLYLQHDLSAISPGPLTPAVDLRMRALSDASGHATAASFHFTPASIARAISAGETAQSILAFLDKVSLSGIPQPLDYLVNETAARHGILRVGALPSGDPDAVSYVRSTDAALLHTLLVDRALGALSLHSDGDRLVSRRDRTQVYWSLLDSRYPVAAEDSRGRIIQLRRPMARRAAPGAAAHPHRTLVERLRLADAGTPVDTGLAWIHRQLELAIRSRSSVIVSVRMPGGAITDHRLEPTSVAGGRLRARDPVSEIERTLPLSSIAAVAAVAADADAPSAEPGAIANTD